MDLYSYCNGDPVNNLDPDGRIATKNSFGTPAQLGLGGVTYDSEFPNANLGTGGNGTSLAPNNTGTTRNNDGPWTVGVQWLTGKGQRTQKFTDGDPFTEMLRKHDHIQDTLTMVADRVINGGKLEGANPYNLGGIQGVPKYMRDYSTLLTGGLTGNIAVTYLGGYSLTYKVVQPVDYGSGVAQVKMHVFNPSTIESATHPPVIGYTEWWSRNIGKPLNKFFSTGPLSRTTQTFDWTETVALPSTE